MKQSPTNELTQFILADLYCRGVFAWRNNTAGMPVRSGGVVIAMKASGKTGTPDILCLAPRNLPFIAGVEIKTGQDRLRPEQEGFIKTAGTLGAIILVVHTKDDYVQKISTVMESCTNVSRML